MASYQGGKGIIGKRIYDVITIIEQDNMIKKGTSKKMHYFEPFVGYGGVMKYFASEKDRVTQACDYNPSIILMWKKLKTGWIPQTKCTYNQYQRLKKSKTPSAEKGFICHCCSFGGIYEGSFRNDKNYAEMGSRSLLKRIENMKKTRFLNSRSYDKFNPKNKLIYLDPPYKDNTYGNINSYFKFDHDKFWDIVRKWSKYNIVVISENKAPKDFKKIWYKKCNIRHAGHHFKGGIKVENECLFIHKDLYNKLSSRAKSDIKKIV